MSRVTKDQLYKEYIQRMLNQDELGRKQSLDLVQAFVNDLYLTDRASLEIYNEHFRHKSRNYINYNLFRARKHFLRKWYHEPEFHIGNINRRLLTKDQIVYDREFSPHIWDGERFWKIKFFSK